MKESSTLVLLFLSLCSLTACAAFGYKPDPELDVVTFEDTLGHIASEGVLPTIAFLAYRMYSNLTFDKRLQATLKKKPGILKETT